MGCEAPNLRRMKINVIKVGGQVVEEAESLHSLLASFASLPGAKVLVHGGGRKATKVAAALGIETLMVDGRRVTDAGMLRVVTMVYGGLVNKNIVAALQGLGVNAVGLTGADMNLILSVRRPPVKALDGSTVDYGFVGDVREVSASALTTLLEAGYTPVVAPLTHDGKGKLLNTNADTIASSVASALAENGHEVTLSFCFEKAGVLRNPDDEGSLIPLITKKDFDAYIADGTVSGGMIPKLSNAFKALEAGVAEVVITKSDSLGGGTKIKLK